MGDLSIFANAYNGIMKLVQVENIRREREREWKMKMVVVGVAGLRSHCRYVWLYGEFSGMVHPRYDYTINPT
jgi:hypothetical protein